MNNTTTKRNLTIVAIFMAATLVVGMFAAAAPTTQTAFAFSNKKKGDENSKNGNTITIQKCKQAATQSGFDNDQEQECENLICTHPGENATCVQEGAVSAVQAPVNKTQPVKLTCEQCFTHFLTSSQLAKLTRVFTLEQLCVRAMEFTAGDVLNALLEDGVSVSVAAQVIQCLLNAGIHFAT